MSCHVDNAQPATDYTTPHVTRRDNRARAAFFKPLHGDGHDGWRLPLRNAELAGEFAPPRHGTEECFSESSEETCPASKS